MNKILTTIDKWDTTIAKLQGIKFNGGALDFYWYFIPRVVATATVFGYLIYLVITA